MSLRSLDEPTGCGATYRRGYCLPSETDLQCTQPQLEDGSIYRQNRLTRPQANACRASTHDHLLQRVWGMDTTGGLWWVREVVKRLRRKLGDDTDNPAYILTQPRVGYRMGRGETSEPVGSRQD